MTLKKKFWSVVKSDLRCSFTSTNFIEFNEIFGELRVKFCGVRRNFVFNYDTSAAFFF